jgi:hypothetical protein
MRPASDRPKAIYSNSSRAFASLFTGSVAARGARRGLSGRMADDDLGCPPPVSARDHPARRLAPCTFHAQLSSTPSANVALASRRGGGDACGPAVLAVARGFESGARRKRVTHSHGGLTLVSVAGSELRHAETMQRSGDQDLAQVPLENLAISVAR